MELTGYKGRYAIGLQTFTTQFLSQVENSLPMIKMEYYNKIFSCWRYDSNGTYSFTSDTNITVLFPRVFCMCQVARAWAFEMNSFQWELAHLNIWWFVHLQLLCNDLQTLNLVGVSLLILGELFAYNNTSLMVLMLFRTWWIFFLCHRQHLAVLPSIAIVLKSWENVRKQFILPWVLEKSSLRERTIGMFSKEVQAASEKDTHFKDHTEAGRGVIMSLKFRPYSRKSVQWVFVAN